MSETTTETMQVVGTTELERQAWRDAAAANAEALRPEDPKPKYSIKELECALTDREHAKIGIEHATATMALKSFDEETKSLLAERKAERAKLEAKVADLQTAALTGRVKRQVRTVTFKSLAQNRMWVVRLDTKEQIDEQPLPSNERQANLPLPHRDEQLSLDDANEGEPDDDMDLDELDEEGAELEDGDGEGTEGAEASDPDAAAQAVPPGQDSTTNLTGDPDQTDPTEITAPADVISGKAVKKSSKKSKDA